VPVWTSFVLGYGGGFVDAGGKLMTDDAAAIDAAKMYQTLLAKYGPQGVAGFNWNEAQSLFLQGKAAMWLDGIGFAQPLEDPTKSRIVGKVGYGVMPPGPKAQVSAMFGDGEGISSFSKKKGPAWLYLQWASNKTNQFRMLQAAAGAPVRTSAYLAAQTSPDIKAPKQWVECMLTSTRIAQPGLPIIVPVTEFRDVFGIALTNMINGADPAAELRKATAEFQPILDKSEKA
jgi:multiple sugar transport system substrate-binding protein